jgi:hypothetical protein
MFHGSIFAIIQHCKEKGNLTLLLCFSISTHAA